MIINIKNNGKILKDKDNLNLPDLTILTGENGSGKTQLLDYLKNEPNFFGMLSNNQNSDKIIKVMNNNGDELKDIVFTLPGIKPNNIYQPPTLPLIEQVKHQWGALEPITKSFPLIRHLEFNDENQELGALNNAITDFVNNIIIKENNNKTQLNLKKIDLNQLRLLKKISRQSKKNIEEIKFLDFIIFYDIPSNIFSSGLDLLFHQFHLKLKYYKELTDNVSPPWDVFNDILEKANFKYKAEYQPSLDDFSSTPIKLLDKENGLNVDFTSLSSGEQTIMALIFVLYNSSNNGKFPEVILFDEPDAHLHPSLTKLFLKVIKEVLVEEQKVKVILTTHSPSTIALAPDESIYRMDRTLGYPVKENKDKAVQSLSSGLASVSIENGNLGIVYNIKQTSKHILFTEGITDKIILDIAWEKLYNNNEKPFFIQDCFDATFLANLFSRGDQQPDGIFHQFPKKILIALFDFDQAGYSCWNRDNKFILDNENNPFNCLARSYKNAYKILLPVPNEEDIKKLVIKNGHNTFKDKSNLTIESLFLNVPEFQQKHFINEIVPGGGNIFTFKGDKRGFAENIEKLEPEYFDNFKPLFEKIELIISSHIVK